MHVCDLFATAWTHVWMVLRALVHLGGVSAPVTILIQTPPPPQPPNLTWEPLHTLSPNHIIPTQSIQSPGKASTLLQFDTDGEFKGENTEWLLKEKENRERGKEVKGKLVGKSNSKVDHLWDREQKEQVLNLVKEKGKANRSLLKSQAAEQDKIIFSALREACTGLTASH